MNGPTREGRLSTRRHKKKRSEERHRFPRGGWGHATKPKRMRPIFVTVAVAPPLSPQHKRQHTKGLLPRVIGPGPPLAEQTMPKPAVLVGTAGRAARR